MKVYLVIKDSGELNGDDWASAFGVFATKEHARKWIEKSIEEEPELYPLDIITTDLIGS